MKKNWSVFQMVLMVAVTSLATYILHQLLRYSGWGWFGFIATMVWVLLVFSIALTQPLYFWGNEKVGDSVWIERLNIMGYLSFSYVSDMLTLILFRDVIGFAAWGGFAAGWWDWDGYSLYSGDWTLFTLLIPFPLIAIGYLTIDLGPFVRKIKIKDDRVPEVFRGFKILQMSDIHFGPMMKDRWVRKLINKINRQNFNVIVLTGDIVDCDPGRFAENLWGLEKFKAEHGVLYCSGNHEYYWGFSKIRPVLEKAGHRILQNESFDLIRAGKKLSIAGVPDPVAKYFPNEATPNWDQLEKILADYKILLAHQPHLADEAINRNFQLQLSGHTHSGQFFPWNILIYVFQKYTKGLYRIKKKGCSSSSEDLLLYVNQGTGFWGPPTRLGTYCELTIIEL